MGGGWGEGRVGGRGGGGVGKIFSREPTGNHQILG